MTHAKPCPVCGRPAQTRFRPFCSARCAEVDLGRWFTGQYRIPVRDEEADRQAISREPPD